MTPPPQPSSSASQRGIDVRDALSILSSRAKSGGDAAITENGGPSSVPDELKGMGQTIDVSDQMEFANNKNGPGCGCASNGNDGDAEGGTTSSSSLSEEETKKHESMRRERERRGEEIREKLSSMDVSDLLGTVFGAQQERVATYKAFEEGLSVILASGNITTYPALCAKVTASFSVLSDTINAVKSIFETQHKRKDVTNFITRLQKSEGEKLNLTAALHLEKLRLRNSQLETREEEGDDDRTERLLKEGIQTLERKIANVVESINETLDELRCIAADEA